MWKNHYRIAERQLTTGKFKKLEWHVSKALEFARAANDQMQIAKTLSLLSKFYMDTDNPLAAETLRQSVASAEQAYGPNSLELAEELELLSCVLEFVPELAASEAARLKALAIRETFNESEDLLDALDFLVEFYVKQNRFEQAETFVLRALEVRKRIYGPLSEEVESEIEQYAAILEELGRKEEAAQLESLLHRCSTCGPEEAHAKYAPEVETIISSVKEIESQGNLDKSIETLRDALVSLRDVADKQCSLLADSDPFRELKMRAFSNPPRWAKSSLAQLLRLKCENEDRRDLLIEAAEHLRNLLAESINLSDRLHLMLTILDLAEADDACYDELDKLITESPVCATSMYTKALSMFKRQGSTKASRAAMKAALDFNRYVPEVFATGCSPEEVPNHFSFGDRAEAQGYYLEASSQWISTPGGVEFMIEVMARTLPASWRRNFDRYAGANNSVVSQISLPALS